MDAELRNWYLSNLGIVQYKPRSEDLVALPFHVPVDDGPTKPATSSVKDEVASVLELVRETTDHTAQPVEDLSGQEAEPESKPTPTIEVPTFRLACWQPCDDLLVFNHLAPDGGPEPEQLQLLSNILRAIGRLPASLPAPELIDWPMAHGGDVSEAAARSLLSVFLDARIKKRGVLWVLLMGEVAAELLSPSESGYSDALGRREEIAGGAKTIVVRSLQEMLADASMKAQTWQAIKCLANQP